MSDTSGGYIRAVADLDAADTEASGARKSNWMQRGLDLLYSVEELPIAPKKIAEKAISWHVDRQRSRAQTDPEYARIETLRHEGATPGTVRFLDGELGMREWDLQDEIADRITPDPVWLPVAFRLRDDWTLSAGARKVTRALQRGMRGWADEDLWSLDHVLAARTGDQLLALAAIAHGYPGTQEYPTFESWTRDLRTHGEALRAYGNSTGVDAHLDRWHTLRTTEGSEGETEAAWKEMREHEERLAGAASAAWAWIALHHASLWD